MKSEPILTSAYIPKAHGGACEHCEKCRVDARWLGREGLDELSSVASVTFCFMLFGYISENLQKQYRDDSHK